MRVALLEVSHWHFPLYAPALHAAGVDVVAVSDRDAAIRARVAADFGARPYADGHRLIEAGAFDFAFVLGRHRGMPALARALVERRLPFAIEKPGGLDSGDVAGLRAAAQARGLHVAVALVQRIGPLYAALERLRREEGAAFTHSSWRFLAGPPARYRESGNEWMLDPAESGGGCLINLAPHFVDLAQLVHGEPAGPVLARLSSRVHAQAVEDYAMVSLQTANGGTALVETGYCFPEHPAKREFSFTLAGPTHHVQSVPGGIAVVRVGSDEVETLALELDSDPLYARFVERVLADASAGCAPFAGLGDLERVMRTIDAAYAAAAPSC